MYIRVPVDKIESNPFQRRFDYGDVDELARSIRAMIEARPETSGLLQVPPARLWDVDAGKCLALENLEGQQEILDLLHGDLVELQLAAGHRRLAAFKQMALNENIAGLASEYATFPVELQEMSDEQMFDVAWVENKERLDPNPIEEAMMLQEAIELFGWTQEEVAKRWRLSRSGVANKLRLLNLPEDARAAIEGGRLSERHGRLLLSALNKSPAIYERVAGEVMTSGATPSEDVIETARELAPTYHRIYAVNRVLSEFQCVACGGPIEPVNNQVYHDWELDTGETYMCTACYRAGTGWTPPSLSDAERIVGDVVRNQSYSLEKADWPLDVEVGEGDPAIHAGRCEKCAQRAEVLCWDKGCAAKKAEYWQAHLDSVFLERLREQFDAEAPIRVGWTGEMLSGSDETDLAMVRDGWCSPKCERLGFRRQQHGGIRPFEDLAYVYHCNHPSSHRACQRRYRNTQRSEDEVEAEKLAKRQERRNREHASALEEQALATVSKALLQGNPNTWFYLANALSPGDDVKRGQVAPDGYAAIVARRILGRPTAAIYVWGAEDVPERAEKLVREKLERLGITQPEQIENLGKRLERIEGFILGEGGAVRENLTPEQVEGNLVNLDNLAMDLMQALKDGRVSELDDARMNARVQELWAKLERVRL